MLNSRIFALSLIAAAAFAAPAQAGVLDNVQIKVGVSGVIPDESADITVIGGDVDISDEYVPTLAIEYFFNDNVSAELLCCAAQHDVKAVGTALGTVDLGQITHFPPTVTLKYRWTNLGAFQPYVGAGVNYTHFFNEELPAGGTVTSISYDDSFGGALQAGADFKLNDHWSLNADVRKIWISTDVTIMAGATRIDANVDVNPWVTSLGVGYRF
ncbi:MAG: OmpW family protein [Hyphomonadaceae bacterium]|nr:MAG: outer membrane protein [Caulobacteraceae bacterium]MBT9446967.1 OmpW family protein [Hyphomonadaceae bacterium]TPW08142.1 MAG: outer membrane protein [Alphaproteobacteria bacterium]